MDPPSSLASLSTPAPASTPSRSPRRRTSSPLRELRWLLLVAPLLDRVDPGRLAFAVGCALLALVVRHGLEADPDRD